MVEKLTLVAELKLWSLATNPHNPLHSIFFLMCLSRPITPDLSCIYHDLAEQKVLHTRNPFCQIIHFTRNTFFLLHQYIPTTLNNSPVTIFA